MTRREVAAVLAGPTVLAAASWVFDKNSLIGIAIAVAVLLVVFLRLTAGPVRGEAVREPRPLPRRVPSRLTSDGSSLGSVHARRSTRPRARASSTH